MNSKRDTLWACFLAVLLIALPLRGSAAELPLFAEDDTFDVVFEFPVRTIIGKSKKKPVVDGQVNYTNEAGETVTLSMKMKTRGKTRLEYCKYPPLSMNLKRKEAIGTIFEGQNKLKIVTLCKTGGDFDRYLLQEFAIYKALNALTDRSFRVRWLNATYRDSAGKDKDFTAPAFFLESDDELADRIGYSKYDALTINPSQLDASYASLLSLFQYLIGNTDYSMLRGPDDDGCCHNGKVVVPPGSDSGWLVVPYDFDQAGYIYTKYSSPAALLGLRSVRERAYRGRCSHLDHLGESIALMNERREAVEAALLPNGLQGRDLESAKVYVSDFYQTINDASRREDRIEDECLGGD